jgi:hypothetical protein
MTPGFAVDTPRMEADTAKLNFRDDELPKLNFRDDVTLPNRRGDDAGLEIKVILNTVSFAHEGSDP